MAKIFQREIISKVLKGSESNLTLEQLKNQRKGAKLFLVSYLVVIFFFKVVRLGDFDGFWQ